LWAELWKSKPAADFCVPALRIIQAAGAKPVLRKAQEVVRSELPSVERGLQLIAASTIDLTDIAAGHKETASMRGRLYGEACKSDHFDEALIRCVIEFFG
jgi:hypothetical protein